MQLLTAGDKFPKNVNKIKCIQTRANKFGIGSVVPDLVHVF